MIRWAFSSLMLLGSLTSFLGCSVIPAETLKMVNGPAPEVRLSLASGDYVALSAYQGKRVVLGFWDTRCPHSQQMIQELNEYAGKAAGQPEIIFFAVNIDENEQTDVWKKVVEKGGLRNLRHVHSGNGPLDEAFLMFNLTAIPAVIVVSPNGVVEKVSNDADVVENFIR